jgi:hypothetical protein
MVRFQKAVATLQQSNILTQDNDESFNCTFLSSNTRVGTRTHRLEALELLTRWNAFILTEFCVITPTPTLLNIKFYSLALNPSDLEALHKVFALTLQMKLSADMNRCFGDCIYKCDMVGGVLEEYMFEFSMQDADAPFRAVANKMMLSHEITRIQRYSSPGDCRHLYKELRNEGKWNWKGDAVGQQNDIYGITHMTEDPRFSHLSIGNQNKAEKKLRETESPFHDILFIVLIHNIFFNHHQINFLDLYVVLPYDLLRNARQLLLCKRRKGSFRRPIIFRVFGEWVVHDCKEDIHFIFPSFGEAFLGWFAWTFYTYAKLEEFLDLEKTIFFLTIKRPCLHNIFLKMSNLYKK